MIAGTRVLLLATLLLPIGYADAQVLPWPGEPGGMQSAPPRPQEMLRLPGGVPPRPWVGKPSPAFATKLRHWRLKFELGEPINGPEKGAFPSFAPGTRQDGTARIVSQLAPSAPISLTPVMERTRYVPARDPRTDPRDKVVTKDILDVLRSREVARFIATERADAAQLDVDKNFAVALVQDFHVALRTPRKKEHVWSINWRVETTPTDPHYVGYEAWGVFAKANGALKPFYLAAREASADGTSADYYYVLAVGDLDGDGIDEMIVREMMFEAEQDDLEILGWEHGSPVTIHKIPERTLEIR